MRDFILVEPVYNFQKRLFFLMGQRREILAVLLNSTALGLCALNSPLKKHFWKLDWFSNDCGDSNERF